ncbi:zinc finger protein [Aphelenchoides avenae]|nr:zinc finger protein [Aphelenchus avenae]
MPDYADEHAQDHDIHDHLAIARLIVQGGWVEDLGLTWEMLFPDRPAGAAASKEAIAKLERLTKSDVEPKSQCPVCLAEFGDADESEVLLRMPCKHLFHEKCILAWLNNANSCPLCRHELPVDDEVYEEYRRQKARIAERDADIVELHDSMYS